MEPYHIIGRRIARIDGLSQATGDAVYTTDIVLPRMLHGKILRSPLPHARILNVEVEKARRLPGVKAVITGEDTAGKLFGLFADEPAVAVDKVRYVGEAVAAVAATDEDIAEEALDLIRVAYEPLPAVFDPLQAMQAGAPLLHESQGSNISLHSEYHVGDVERGFAEADHVREDTFSTSAQCHCCLEPHGAVADFRPDGKLTVWSSTQGPFSLAETWHTPLRCRWGTSGSSSRELAAGSEASGS